MICSTTVASSGLRNRARGRIFAALLALSATCDLVRGSEPDVAAPARLARASGAAQDVARPLREASGSSRSASELLRFFNADTKIAQAGRVDGLGEDELTFEDAASRGVVVVGVVDSLTGKIKDRGYGVITRSFRTRCFYVFCCAHQIKVGKEIDRNSIRVTLRDGTSLKPERLEWDDQREVDICVMEFSYAVVGDSEIVPLKLHDADSVGVAGVSVSLLEPAPGYHSRDGMFVAPRYSPDVPGDNLLTLQAPVQGNCSGSPVVDKKTNRVYGVVRGYDKQALGRRTSYARSIVDFIRFAEARFSDDADARFADLAAVD